MKTFKQELEFTKTEPRLKIHSFHRYFGKLIPAIPRTAIRLYTSSPNDLVLDPFCGSGTTLVEAMALGRNAIGIDVNPLAVLMTQVKTTLLNDKDLSDQLARLMPEALRDNGKNALEESPFCINKDHWYQEDVIRNLVVVKRNIDRCIDERFKPFFLLCLSAANREVSNSDPKHVFPGYSKRLRRLDENGQRVVDVFQTFEQKCQSRIRAMSEFALYGAGFSEVRATTGDARELPESVKNVALVVMNPPYISSIRYLETMKLEMYWLGLLKSLDEQYVLDRRGIGTEKFPIQEYRHFAKTGVAKVDEITERIYDQGQKKMAMTVTQYFKDMEQVFSELRRVLRPHGCVVIKISDSNVRKILVPTTDLFVESLTTRHGFILKERFDDPFKSRSLLTKRNTYSGRMDSDSILVFQKV